ncbi:MAG: hypothetical protein IKX51_04955 [Bacteroidales bacterium]|nr:hypothetical protein [Bacteroidales bacterium]
MKNYFLALMCTAAFATIGLMASCDEENSGKESNEGNEPVEFVDLDLTSHTKWKSANENGFYDYESAMEKFGTSLPTKVQLQELKNECTWVWNSAKKGFDIEGSNGNSIFLPAAGYIDCVGDLRRVGELGFYWSSTIDHDDYAWDYYFVSDSVGIYSSSFCHNLSVRLVQN